MHPLTHQLATQRASSDGEARIVAHSGDLFIVTPTGEVWQVFDSEGPNGETRANPRDDVRVWARIFISGATGNPVRIYRFGIGESRSTSPIRLLLQLERAKTGDDRAA